MKKTALIPACCPDGTMIDVIQDLKAESFDIAVVDDGSPADCQPVFKEAEKYASVILRRYVDNTGDADNVYVIRDGVKFTYAELAKEVETKK